MNRIHRCLTALLLSAELAGCVPGGEKTEITVGNLNFVTNSMANSAEADAERLVVKRFENKFPQIKVKPEEFSYTQDGFIAMAASRQLPMFFNTWFSESKRVAQAGFATDLTEEFEKYDLDDKMNPEIKKIACVDGRYYGIPSETYCMGLQINRELFRQAGLADETGHALLPKTYDELAEFAKIIKEKTGKYGFGIPCYNRNGGWSFMNIAWSYGVTFMKCEQGKWIASFDSDECEKAFKYIYDLRWKYDVIPYQPEMTIINLKTMYAKNELAMFFSVGGNFDVCLDREHMNRDDIVMASVPEGPAGRKALLGGTMYMISSDATPEQTDACMKWAGASGYMPELDNQKIKALKQKLEINSSKNYVIGCSSPDIWINPEWKEKRQEVYDKYINVDIKNFEDYNNFSNVELILEEPQNCQDLYGIIDDCLEEILTDRDCNIREIIRKANKNFQENYLDIVK